jgi:hypothetical protein
MRPARERARAARAHPYEPKVQRQASKPLSSDGTERTQTFLQSSHNGVLPILRVVDSDGNPLNLFRHQAEAVLKSLAADWLLIFHEAGLGKTAVLIQVFAAHWLKWTPSPIDKARLTRIPRLARAEPPPFTVCMIVTVPPATLPQWEETAHAWLQFPNPKAYDIVVTNKKRLITKDMLARVRVLVISHATLTGLFKKSFEYIDRKWVRKPNATLHPIFQKTWHILGIDEVQSCRNPETEVSASHKQLAEGFVKNGRRVGGCFKRFGLTARPIVNSPLDLTGICSAIAAPKAYRTKEYWTLNQKQSTVNPVAVQNFQQHIDRARNNTISLPPLVQTYFDFQATLSPDATKKYNLLLQQARDMRSGSCGSEQIVRLMGVLQRLQQALVSPLLAEHGADKFKQNPHLFDEAALENTGSKQALLDRIKERMREGHNRIVVAVQHVSLIEIAKRYLMLKEPNIAAIFTYDGSQNLSQRQTSKRLFLTSERSILFLSIGAGGTGLHLLPCDCEILWGSRPFSPATTWQAAKRIHRFGQTKTVYIDHLISRGSIDYAVEKLHNDKDGLAVAVLDDDWSHFDDGSTWRKTGMLLPFASKLLASGNFPPEEAATPAENAGA